MAKYKKIIVLFSTISAVIVLFLVINITSKRKFKPIQPQGGNISIRNKYLWDPSLNDNKGDLWIPLGVAYQTWNKPLNQWQDNKEIKKDLDDMWNMGADAIRADFVWGHIEIQEDKFDWTKYDYFLEECRKRGIHVFPLIGYQWPPEWAPAEWKTKHPPDPSHTKDSLDSDIISYEHPKLREHYYKFIKKVIQRYSKNGERSDLGSTIAAWVLGNEYGYLGLWSMKYDGYDDSSIEAFRNWLQKKYVSVARLNEQWKKDITDNYLPHYPYKSFKEADMPAPYGYEVTASTKFKGRNKASWYDLLQWRKESIGNFVALGAKAAKEADPEHLITYSFLSMFFSETDYYYQSEDISVIAETCKRLGYPLDFWSINNYPRNSYDREREISSAKFGLIKAINESNLPVLATETGVSTDPSFDVFDAEEQGKLVANSVLELLINKAMGVMVFHWSDRNWKGATEYERKFGLVTEEKKKKPSYYRIKKLFKAIRDNSLDKILLNSDIKKTDIAFFRDDATDTINQRYLIQSMELFGTLNRIGYSPGFMGHKAFIDGEYKKYKAIVLPRNEKMHEDILNKLDDVIKTVKIHADADIPGLMDEYGHDRTKNKKWKDTVEKIFGIDVSKILIDENLEDRIFPNGFFEMPAAQYYMSTIPVVSQIIGFKDKITTWKFYSENIKANSGEILAYFDKPKKTPAIVINKNAAISLIPLGDSLLTYKDRVNFIKLIYTKKFGISPYVETSNPYIWSDYLKYPEQNLLLFVVRNLDKNNAQYTSIKFSDLKVRGVKIIFNNVDSDPGIKYERSSFVAKLEPLQTLLLLINTAQRASTKK